jgi:hypothetical protein
MSESAWKLIVESYERELKNATTEAEKARWQAAIDASLTEANKQEIIESGSIKATAAEKADKKARQAENARRKKAIDDIPDLIERGKIRIEDPSNFTPVVASSINNAIDDVVDASDNIIDDAYFASLSDVPDYMVDDAGDYFDDAIDYIDEVNPFDVDDAPTAPQRLQALNTVVDDLTTGGPQAAGKKVMFPELTARVRSAIDQSIDLAVDISNDISKGASAGSSVISSVRSGASSAAKAARKTNTAKGIIGSMNEARNIVSGLSTAKKTGITLGALGTIGALSSRSRDRRRN